jgi:HEAT repeat protein
MTIPSTNPDLTLEELVSLLKATGRSARLNAAAALACRGAKAKKAVPALAEALKDHDAGVRKLAALALGDIGAGAKGAVPALVAALRDENASVRRRVVVALGEIGDTIAVLALREAAKEGDEAVRESAANALQTLTREAQKRAA